jgi:hypothetical protein
MDARLGLASIGRDMLGTTTVRHRLNRGDSCASNERISLKGVTPALVSWLVWTTRGPLVLALDRTDNLRGCRAALLFGFTAARLLRRCGAEDAHAVGTRRSGQAN